MLDRLRDRFPWLTTPLAVHQRVGDVGGGPLASSIALAGFLSLFPLLLVAIAVLGFVTHGRTDFPDEVIEGLGLTGRAADQVPEAVAEAEPEDAERGGRPDEQPGTPDETVTGRA